MPNINAVESPHVLNETLVRKHFASGTFNHAFPIKKTITITWPLENDWGYSCRESPFLAAIREDFVRVTESDVLRDDKT